MMAITQMNWSGFADQDLHLMSGLTSPKLIQLLEVYDATAKTWYYGDQVPAAAGFSIYFSVGFNALMTPDGLTSGHGVTVDPDTGEVTVLASTPAGPPLRSFIINVTGTQTGSTGATPLSTTIRVYVHRALVKRWLTPDELSVRQGATNMRFSVLASFDDGVIGDITNWGYLIAPPTDPRITFVHRTGSAKPVHAWSVDGQIPAPGTVTIDPNSGEITAHTSGGGAEVHLVDESAHTLASAPVYAAPPWNTPTKVTRIAGRGFAAMTDPRIRNVLFLPDGFVDDIDGMDRINYEAQVRQLVTLLRTNVFTRPFDLLADSFNFFSAWVPSPQGGVTALDEVYTYQVVTRHDAMSGDNLYQQGLQVELPAPPANPPPQSLSLKELIGTVGLPSPVFDPPGSAPGTDAAGRVHDWQTLYGSVPTLVRTTAESTTTGWTGTPMSCSTNAIPPSTPRLTSGPAPT
jgi:hypothetical protein